MKFEPHKWPLVRYFRRPATSVPPKTGLEIARNNASDTSVIDTTAFADSVLKQLQASGLIPDGAEVRVHHIPVTGAGPIDPRAGIKPPIDSGTNGWTWSQWSKEVGIDIPGWAFCRFANRIGADGVGFVFGYVRGSFGVWQQPFDVCATTEEGLDQRSTILTCITHLRTGMGVGIFADRFVAMMAADLAEKVCPGGYDDGPSLPAMWRGENWSRTLTAWHGIGITESINANAHDQHGTRFPIYGQDNESVMAGKPERLS